MTKRREPLTYHRALTKAAALIGWDRIAALCGVTERSVRLWSDPDCETEVRLIDAERIDRAVLEHGGQIAPFHQTYSLRLGICGQDEAQGHDLAVIAARAAKEAGEAVSAMVSASLPSASPSDVRKARAEIEEAISVMTASLSALGGRTDG